VASSLGTFSVGRPVTSTVPVDVYCLWTYYARFNQKNASQIMFMNKFSIANQAQLTISVVKLDLIML